VKYSEALQARAALGSLSAYRGQTFAGVTNTMAAALASNSTVFAARYPVTTSGRVVVQWIHLHYVCIANFTTLVTAGRRLALRRGSGGDASGGTPIDAMRNQSSGTETLLTGSVSTTTALTMTGITYETGTRARLLLAQAGTAGNDYDEIWAPEDPLILLPGELFGIVAPAAFDAGGTWQLSVKGGAVEVGAT
jgi:hypothetical protein